MNYDIKIDRAISKMLTGKHDNGKERKNVNKLIRENLN